MKAKVAYITIIRRLLCVHKYVEGQGHYSASKLFVTNSIITFDALLRKRAFGSWVIPGQINTPSAPSKNRFLFKFCMKVVKNK